MATIEPADFYQFLLARRSAVFLVDPAPSPAIVEKILTAAGTVPDHGGLQPFRFVVIEGEGRDRFGEALVNAAEEAKGTTLEEAVRPKIKAKAFAAPLQILIIYSPVPGTKVPFTEQMAAAACTGYAMILAANALGSAAVWKSFAYPPGSALRQLLELKEGEQSLGWINLGTERQKEGATDSKTNRIPVRARLKHTVIFVK